MIKDSEIDYMKALLTQEIDHKPEPDEKPTASEEKPGHIIFAYCGSIEIGRIGDVEQIEGAIKNFLDSNEDQKVPVRFECMELGINVNEETSKKVERIICRTKTLFFIWMFAPLMRQFR